MKATDENTKLDSGNNSTVFNSDTTEYRQNDRLDPIVNISSKSGYVDSDMMGEAIRRWESSRYWSK